MFHFSLLFRVYYASMLISQNQDAEYEKHWYVRHVTATVKVLHCGCQTDRDALILFQLSVR